MYQLYLALDGDLEAMLTRIDPSRRERAPLSITLPSGRVASAYVSTGEDRVPMLEEVAKAGFEKWRGMQHNFMLASSIRVYAVASARFMALLDAASIADQVGPNTEEALLDAAEHVEKLRNALIVESERMRGALRGWFGRYPHFSPWGPENKDWTPEWGEPAQTTEDSGSTTLE